MYKLNFLYRVDVYYNYQLLFNIKPPCIEEMCLYHKKIEEE